ncbi:RNA polymerase sigma-70 factor, ECF subfamily [plant metagenome]|uniref:Probable sigma-70 factor, ECF subfamily n=1 Tax=plant metagenome TaxID=1297885 RepID=A0A484U5Q7_9ZZZZ
MQETQRAINESVGALYAEHHGWLQRRLDFRLQDRHVAADLAQDTFLNLLTRRNLPPLREPRAFLSSIAHGLLVDFWRRRDIEHAWLAALADRPEALQPSPEAQAQMLQALVEIDRKLFRLGERPRAAFLMHRIQGMTHPDIAASLGLSERTVRKYIAQAMLSFLMDDTLAPLAAGAC